MLQPARAISLVSLGVRLFALVLTIPLLYANAWAQSAVEARVANVSGKATISNSARASSPLRKGEILAVGDVVDTHGGGRVRIELSDGSVVLVLPETRLVIQDYRASTSLRELLKVVIGRVRIKINRFGSQPNPYRVNSPTASIGVRGTEFSVVVDASGNTTVVVYEGLVEVTSLSDPKDRVLVEPGRGVIVRPNEPIRFISPEPDIDERNGRDGINGESGRTAAGVYERYVDSVVDSGENPLSSRFTAFPDSHLDSLENPSYATEFTTAEGRVFLLPSFSGTRANDRRAALFGFGDIRPVDYSLSPQVSFFVPLPKYRSVLGGSVAFSRNGVQSFSPDAINSQATFGRATNNFFNASFVFARRFGTDGRTSIGLGVDFLSQRGSLLNLTTQADGGGLTERERIEARSNAERTRFTVGFSRDIGSGSKLGIFYRYGYTSANDRNRLHTLDGVPLPLEQAAETGHSSEIGLRFRSFITRRLFYGAEGNLLIGRGNESIGHASVVEFKERSHTTSATLGFGLGYALRPRTVFSFDVTGGLVRNRGMLYENATGNLLESERKRTYFLSLHAAVQADVWRRLFVSGSLLSLTQSHTNDFALFPSSFGRPSITDGVFPPYIRTRTRFTDYSSNFGIGWRFTPNFLAQYIFSTDFGKTSPRHTFLLRYTFNIGEK